MLVKAIILFLFGIISTFHVFGQRRTTSVRGYYRKDGTYVRPHTRHYNSSSSTSSSVYNYHSSNTQPTVEIAPSSLKVDTISNYNYSKTSNTIIHNYEIVPATLSSAPVEYISTKNGYVEKQSGENGELIIYISVLRYYNKIIDICPITRGYSNKWDFEKVKHSFRKELISAEHALELVSEYNWIISSGNISRDFSYSYSRKLLPSYLTIKIEAMKLK
ncbi:hypothetical protein D3C72_544760 [compost metagenome]